jgi:hypothetical protein
MLCWGLCGDDCVWTPVEKYEMMIVNKLVDQNNRTVRTMLAENSTPKTQARAFSFFAFSGNLGIFLGPLIGIFPSGKETVDFS